MSKIDDKDSNNKDKHSKQPSDSPEDPRRPTRGDSTEQATAAIGNVSLNNSNGSTSRTPEKRPSGGAGAGNRVSLLSQQAPPNPSAPVPLPHPAPSHTSNVDGSSYTDGYGLPSSAMSVDRSTVASSSSASADGLMGPLSERITVKIADLGNGVY